MLVVVVSQSLVPVLVTIFLRGDISAGGKITGYHHRFGGSDSGSIRLVEITRKGRGAKGGNGAIYEGVVEYVDSRGVAHRKSSTFFPDSWTTERVIAEINSSIINAAGGGKNLSGTVRGKSASGVVIEMVIRSGKLDTAYPVLR